MSAKRRLTVDGLLAAAADAGRSAAWLGHWLRIVAASIVPPVGDQSSLDLKPPVTGNSTRRSAAGAGQRFPDDLASRMACWITNSFKASGEEGLLHFLAAVGPMGRADWRGSHTFEVGRHPLRRRRSRALHVTRSPDYLEAAKGLGDLDEAPFGAASRRCWCRTARGAMNAEGSAPVRARRPAGALLEEASPARAAWRTDRCCYAPAYEQQPSGGDASRYRPGPRGAARREPRCQQKIEPIMVSQALRVWAPAQTAKPLASDGECAPPPRRAARALGASHDPHMGGRSEACINPMATNARAAIQGRISAEEGHLDFLQRSLHVCLM